MESSRAAYHPSIHRLACWLAPKDGEPPISGIDYHLKGRAALLGRSLLFLVKAVGQAVLGIVIFSGRLIFQWSFQQARNSFVDRIHKSSQALSISYNCFRSILSPEKLASRLPRLVDSEKIPEKLDLAWNRAQEQAEKEKDKGFIYQSAPKDFPCESSIIESVDSRMEVGACSYIGGRKEMEDAHLATRFDLNIQGETYPVLLFGVFDGHGGSRTSQYLKDKLQQELKETLEEICQDGLTDAAIWNALKITFERLHEKSECLESGSTATVAIVLQGKLWVPNAGDSRTIFVHTKKREFHQLSEDAKPGEPYFQKGMEKRGCWASETWEGGPTISRLNSELSTARAIGDKKLRKKNDPDPKWANPQMNPRPKITSFSVQEISEGDVLMLACDGVYDEGSTRELAGAIIDHPDESAEALARNIVYSAFKSSEEKAAKMPQWLRDKGFGDNESALLVQFKSSLVTDFAEAAPSPIDSSGESEVHVS